ncbi:MAG: ABC transporter permease [Lentisphaerae bacterium]|nr:ABC transporter permease [Lentisphaerota bacterium]
MTAYIIRRILYVLPILLGVNLLVFSLFFLVSTPDDMARQALGDKSQSPEQVQRWKEAHGYHYPLFYNAGQEGWKCLSETIFFRKSAAMFWGDFGLSDMTLEPIGKEIRSRIIPSLCLTVPIFLITIVTNIFVGLLLAGLRGSWADRIAQFGCVLLMSVSALLYIIAGQYLFARELQLVPVSGFLPGWAMAKFLFLPVLVGVFCSLGSGIRFYRTVFLEEINRDYVRTARAKGLSESRVLFLHVLKNAMIPILTNVPVQMLFLVMGNLLLENFFSIPGLGGFTINAIATQDFAIVRAMVFLGSVLYILGLLLSDLCYSLVDPRVRLG